MNTCETARTDAVAATVAEWTAIEALALLERTVACTQSDAAPSNTGFAADCEAKRENKDQIRYKR